MNKAWHEKGKSVKSSYIAQFVVQEYLETTENVPHVTFLIFLQFCPLNDGLKVLEIIFFSQMGLT